MNERIFAALAWALLLLVPFVVAADGADRALPRLATPAETAQPVTGYAPGLGEIMSATQMRHAKLWFAGQAGNWKLAEYELFELQEGFEDAVRFHPQRAKPLPAMTEKAVAELQIAIQNRRGEDFRRAFQALTDACNACHQATEFGFNRVKIPDVNIYSNQEFKYEN